MRAWINGQLLSDPEAPAVPVTDHGLTVGDAVFEAIKVVDGAPFALQRHLDRLERSAKGMGITGVDPEAVRRGVAAVLEGQDLPLAGSGSPSPPAPPPWARAAATRTRP